MKAADDLLSVADSVVAQARRMGVASAEAFVLRSVSGGVRIEKNEVGGIETETSFGIGIRVLKEQRVGFAYVTKSEQAKDGIRDALEASKLSIRLPSFAFPSPAKVPRIAGLYDPKIEGMEAASAIAYARDLARGAKSIHAKLNVTEAGFSYGASTCAIANTEGVGLQQRETSVSASCFVVQSEQGVSTGFASASATRDRLKPLALGQEAARLAMQGRKPVKLERPQAWPLVIRPDPCADLFGTITVPSVYGKPAHRDESYYSGKVGKRVADAKFSLIDDPTTPEGLGSSPFDDEGVVSRPVSPILNGILKGFLFDAQGGAEYGEPTTASGVRLHAFDGRSHKSPPVTSGRNLIVRSTSRPTEKLIASIDDGLLVHDMLGVHTANTVSGDVSVTSSLLFRIRKGAVEGPVAPVSIGGNFHRILEKGILLGDDVKQVADEGAISVPSVRFDGFTVTP
jgi:PmbA protein